jgi:hypothetical protein
MMALLNLGFALAVPFLNHLKDASQIVGLIESHMRQEIPLRVAFELVPFRVLSDAAN